MESRAKTNLSKTQVGGGPRPISTDAFLEVKMNNLENLSNTKVLYVHEECLRSLVRAKGALRAQKAQKSIFGAIDFGPPPKSSPTSYLVETKIADVFHLS